MGIGLLAHGRPSPRSPIRRAPSVSAPPRPAAPRPHPEAPRIPLGDPHRLVEADATDAPDLRGPRGHWVKMGPTEQSGRRPTPARIRQPANVSSEAQEAP